MTKYITILRRDKRVLPKQNIHSAALTFVVIGTREIGIVCVER